MVPLLVVEMVPVRVVEIVPDFAMAVVVISATTIMAPTMDLKFFIVISWISQQIPPLLRLALHWDRNNPFD